MSASETGDARQGELYYLCSRLAAAIFAFHEDPVRSTARRNAWWHTNLNITLVSRPRFFHTLSFTTVLQKSVLVQLGATRAMSISSDVPFLLRAAVPWLKPEDKPQQLPDLLDLKNPRCWPQPLMEKYSSAWWLEPGSDVVELRSWDAEYLQCLTSYGEQVSFIYIPASVYRFLSVSSPWYCCR